MLNWGQLKLLALKKIDPSIDSLASTRNTRDYLKSMVSVANRGLKDLSTAGKYITKKHDITQNPIESIIRTTDNAMNFFQHLKDDVTYIGDGATSYYFEVNNTAEVYIYVGDELLLKINNTIKGKFTPYKGFILNPNKKPVRMVFGGQYPYNYRNFAMYDINFETKDDIWEYVPQKRYDLRELTKDFYRLVTTDVVLETGFDDIRYQKSDDYFWEGDSVLVLNGFQRGAWGIHYYSYPQEITDDTPDNTNIELDPEVAELLVIFMASELYFEESPSKATQFRNQYESGKEQLRPSINYGKSEFIDVQGW